MKKIMPLFLILLLLTACGRAPAAAARKDRPAPTEAPAVSTETGTPDEPENTQEDDPMQEKTADESQEPDVLRDETVTLDGVDSYLRLTLPNGWTWTKGRESAERKSLLLHAPTDDNFIIELNWWASFGMCGTGVDFQEIALANGSTATLATEQSDGLVWWTLIPPASPDQFTLQISATQEMIDAHQADIDAMLDSLQIGVLAHPQTVRQPTADK